MAEAGSKSIDGGTGSMDIWDSLLGSDSRQRPMVNCHWNVSFSSLVRELFSVSFNSHFLHPLSSHWISTLLS